MNGQRAPIPMLYCVLLLPMFTACSGLGEDGEKTATQQSTTQQSTSPTPTDTPEELSACMAGSQPWLKVGKGDFSYSDFAEGDGTVELIHGPQGGWHITIALQAGFLATEGDSLGALTGTIDGDQVGSIPPYVKFRCNTSLPALEAYGFTLILEDEPENLHGKTITVHAKITDPTGQVVESSDDVVIIDPEQL